MLEGRFPLLCYSSKEKIRKQEFNSDCCETDFCNDNISMPAGEHSNYLFSINQNCKIASKQKVFFNHKNCGNGYILFISYSINIIFLLADQIIGLSGAWNFGEATGGRIFQFNIKFVRKDDKFRVTFFAKQQNTAHNLAITGLIP